MKTFMFALTSLLRWLILAVFLCGNLFLTQPAQADAPCSLEHVHTGSITSDETWCASGGTTHYLNGDVTIQAGVTLTIEAGVTVDSGEAYWSKYLIVLGHLDINGTAANPVLLTRSFNYPNQNWGGLFFDGSHGDGSGSINYAVINHAGANFLPPGCTGTCGNGQTAVFVKDLTPGKQVVIHHSTITDNTSKGLFVVNSLVSVTNSAFSQNKYPIWIEGAESVMAYSGNTFSNNAYPYYDNSNYYVAEDSIFLGANALTGQNFSLPVQNGLDAYVFFSGTNIPPGTIMTIEPGVTLRMASNQYLTVRGVLNAVGTPAMPIRLNGIPASSPSVSLYWGGLYFDGNAGEGGGAIRHAIIEHAGANDLPPGCSGTCGTAQTAVFVKDLPADKQFSILYSVIRNSLGKGLYLVNSHTAHVDNSLITGGRIGVDFASNMTVSNLAVTDQTFDSIIVETGYSVDARHLTLARAGRSGFHIYTGASGLLKNSILSHNALAVWSEGSANTSLDTNLADANTILQSGMVTITHMTYGSAAFEEDGYHIQTTSAAAGVGLNGLASMDIEGDTRPWPAESQPDLGADEISIGAFSTFKLFLPFLSR